MEPRALSSRGDSTDTLPFSVDREIEDIAALADVAGADDDRDGAQATTGDSPGPSPLDELARWSD